MTSTLTTVAEVEAHGQRVTYRLGHGPAIDSLHGNVELADLALP